MELKNIKRNHVSNRNDEKNLCSDCAIVFREGLQKSPN